jgi:hypothetical protein
MKKLRAINPDIKGIIAGRYSSDKVMDKFND